MIGIRHDTTPQRIAKHDLASEIFHPDLGTMPVAATVILVLWLEAAAMRRIRKWCKQTGVPFRVSPLGNYVEVHHVDCAALDTVVTVSIGCVNSVGRRSEWAMVARNAAQKTVALGRARFVLAKSDDYYRRRIVPQLLPQLTAPNWWAPPEWLEHFAADIRKEN